jgi:Na+/melibiose symporter-like transporter
MFRNILLDLKLRKRKGLDKPIFILAAITIAILFVAVFYSSVSGWLSDSVNLFTEKSQSLE